jgi:chemotaxis protein methyltransferase CheR
LENEGLNLEYFTKNLKELSGYDLSDYSEKSLERRVKKLLLDNKTDLKGLLSKINQDPTIAERIVQDITVNTTELFRDPDLWQTLKHRILPEFSKLQSFNIWHAGCSSGQEVYSMLILLKELDLFNKAKIYASDINAKMIEKAIDGTYKYRFNLNYLDNYEKVLSENPFNFDDNKKVPFEKYLIINNTKDTISIIPELKDKVIYKVNNLVEMENPFYCKFDLIICRNVMIYFNLNLQNRLSKLFYDNLYDNGVLILGKQETIRGGFASNFDKNGQIYIKRENDFF